MPEYNCGVVVVRIYADEGERRSWWTAFWMTLLIPFMAADETKRAPGVWVENDDGEKRLLFETTTKAEAVEKWLRLERELDELGLKPWAERYRVPLEWLQQSSR